MSLTRGDIEAQSRAGAAVTFDTEYAECRILGGHGMYVDMADASVTPHLIREGFWEAWITTWFLQHCTPEHVVLDVGANQGYYAVLAAAHTQAQVLAFEPQPQLAAMLRATATAFHYPITVVNAAVADYDGETTLYIPSTLKGGASIAGDPRHQGEISEAVRVTVTTIDRYANWIETCPLLIKIDVEGAEEAVWRGMQRTWATHPCTVLLEWEWSRYADSVAFATELLTAADVTLVDYQGGEVPVTHVDQLNTADWITIVLRRKP